MLLCLGLVVKKSENAHVSIMETRAVFALAIGKCCRLLMSAGVRKLCKYCPLHSGIKYSEPVS